MVTRLLTGLIGLLLGTTAHPDPWQTCQQAEVKALRLITVAQATLYRPDCRNGPPLAPPLQLVFRYQRSVPGDAFSKAADHLLRRNLPAPSYDALSPRLARFNQHYRDIEPGDVYTLRHRDGSLTLLLNGEPLVHEPGNDFARAYLSIWFGPQPYSDKLKNALLGQQP